MYVFHEVTSSSAAHRKTDAVRPWYHWGGGGTQAARNGSDSTLQPTQTVSRPRDPGGGYPSSRVYRAGQPVFLVQPFYASLPALRPPRLR